MYVQTKLKPTITRQQFKSLILEYPKLDIDAKLRDLEISVREKFPENGKFTLVWLAKTLEKIDELFYCGQLLRFICDTFGSLRISETVDEERTAGYVVINDEDELELCLNQELFMDLFQDSNKSYHAGGLLCSSMYECLTQVLLHECVHLALTLFERWQMYDDPRDHGKVFMGIVRNMLGHCDSQHGLVPDLVHTESLCETRKHLKVGDKVQVFFKMKYVPAIIFSIQKKFVEVNISGDIYRVHFGLINRV